MAKKAYTREHVSHWARYFDAEQASNTKQKPKDAGDEASPHECRHGVTGVVDEFEQFHGFTGENDKRRQECRRSEVRPVCELYCRITTVW